MLRFLYETEQRSRVKFQRRCDQKAANLWITKLENSRKAIFFSIALKPLKTFRRTNMLNILFTFLNILFELKKPNLLPKSQTAIKRLSLIHLTTLCNSDNHSSTYSYDLGQSIIDLSKFCYKLFLSVPRYKKKKCFLRVSSNCNFKCQRHKNSTKKNI